MALGPSSCLAFLYPLQSKMLDSLLIDHAELVILADKILLTQSHIKGGLLLLLLLFLLIFLNLLDAAGCDWNGPQSDLLSLHGLLN
jgi:hypothetical protein